MVKFFMQRKWNFTYKICGIIMWRTMLSNWTKILNNMFRRAVINHLSFCQQKDFVKQPKHLPPKKNHEKENVRINLYYNLGRVATSLIFVYLYNCFLQFLIFHTWLEGWWIVVHMARPSEAIERSSLLFFFKSIKGDKYGG